MVAIPRPSQGLAMPVAVQLEIGPAYPELPFFGTSTEKWAYSMINKHRKRFGAEFSDEDIYQEIVCCYLKVLQRYPARSCAERYKQLLDKKELWDVVTDVQMSLLKRVVENRFHDLTSSKKKIEKAHAVRVGDTTVDAVDLLVDTNTDNDFADVLRPAYDRLSVEMRLLLNSDMPDKSRRTRRRSSGGRESTESLLRRIASYGGAQLPAIINPPLREQLSAYAGAV